MTSTKAIPVFSIKTKHEGRAFRQAAQQLQCKRKTSAHPNCITQWRSVHYALMFHTYVTQSPQGYYRAARATNIDKLSEVVSSSSQSLRRRLHLEQKPLNSLQEGVDNQSKKNPLVFLMRRTRDDQTLIVSWLVCKDCRNSWIDSVFEVLNTFFCYRRQITKPLNLRTGSNLANGLAHCPSMS